MVCRLNLIFIIDGNFNLEFQKVGFFFVNVNQFYGGLSFIFFIFSEKYHLKHRKMLFTNNNNTSIKKALFHGLFDTFLCNCENSLTTFYSGKINFLSFFLIAKII